METDRGKVHVQPGPRERGVRQYVGGARSNGFTLLELLVGFTAFVMALLAFVKVILATMAATNAGHEATVGQEAARRMIETLHDATFADVFFLYNDDPQDDPNGPGTAPGKNFTVEGLEPRRNDPDGFVGEILFPVAAGAPGVLREDLPDVRFGTPRDLSGDGVFDAQNHAADYGVLPVIVRIDYGGSGSPGRVELRTLLGNLR